MNNAPTLEGYGVRLEPLAQSHIPALTQIAIEPSNWRFMNLRINTPADVQAMVDGALTEAATGATEPWATFVGNEAAGGSRLLDINRTHRTAEIGFTWIAKPWRGAGLNPRVKLLQLTYAFETLDFRRIQLKTHHENLHSQNAMLKLGAQYEGTLRNHMITPEGATRHSKLYSITQEEWPAIKASLLNRIDIEPLSTTGLER